MKQVLYLTNIASPYRGRFFDELSKYCDVTVLYYDRNEEQKDRAADWFTQGSGAHKRVQLQRRVATIGGESLCLDVISWLKKKYDVVVIHGYSSTTAMLAMLWLKLHKIPFYLEVDGGLIREESSGKFRFKRMLVSSAQWWLSSGDATTDFLVHYGAVREKCIKYPFSSLDAADILPAPVSRDEKLSLRRELGMECDKMILSIGQFIPRKGFDILLQSAANMKNKADIFIIGGEPTEAYLKMREEQKLTNVHFVGFLKKEQLLEVYRAADLFVLPTREDIWGLVINEAMAYALPVITTDRCVAGLELVQEGVSGHIVPVEDADALAQKMDAVLSGPMEAMGAAALERIRSYTIENMARVHAQVFEDRS